MGFLSKMRRNIKKKYGAKYEATIVFKDIYGNRRREKVKLYTKPRGKTIQLDHRTRGKIISLRKIKY